MTKPSPTAPPSSPPLNSLALQTQKDRSPSSSRMAARIGKTWPEASLKKYGGLPMMLSWTISLLNAIRPAAFRMMMMMSSSRQKIFWMCFSCYQRNLWSETCSKQTYWWLISQNLIPYSHNIHLCLIRTIFMCTPGVGLCWDWHIQHHIRLGYVLAKLRAGLDKVVGLDHPDIQHTETSQPHCSFHTCPQKLQMWLVIRFQKGTRLFVNI